MSSAIQEAPTPARPRGEGPRPAERGGPAWKRRRKQSFYPTWLHISLREVTCAVRSVLPSLSSYLVRVSMYVCTYVRICYDTTVLLLYYMLLTMDPYKELRIIIVIIAASSSQHHHHLPWIHASKHGVADHHLFIIISITDMFKFDPSTMDLTHGVSFGSSYSSSPSPQCSRSIH